MIREGLSDKVAFEKGHEGSEGMSSADIPRTGNRKCKGPEAGST